MQMKDVIRRKRRECGLTQEQVAERLGVSTPAVNKWENGTTCPDISLLAPLARLLRTDINTLLCFQEDLTEENVVEYTTQITKAAQSEGIEEAFRLIQEKVREYPCCARLLYQMASVLIGLPIVLPCTEEQIRKSNAYAIELYERVETCDDPIYVNRARYVLASRWIQEENYEKAQKMIDLLPEYNGLDKRQLRISMLMKQKKSEEAAELLEKKLNSSIQEVFLLLNSLATVAVWEEDRERAGKLAEYGENVMRIFQWDYSAYTVAFSVAVEEQDAERCLEILEKMLKALEKPYKLEDSILFAHIKQKESDAEQKETDSTAMRTRIKDTLLTAIEKDETFDFLRKKPEFRKLAEKFRGTLRDLKQPGGTV